MLTKKSLHVILKLSELDDDATHCNFIRLPFISTPLALVKWELYLSLLDSFFKKWD